MGLSFAIFEGVMELARSEDPPRWANAATAGALAGGISKLVVYPMDTMKKRLQVAVRSQCGAMQLPLILLLSEASIFAQNLPSHTKYNTLLHCIRDTARHEGFTAFYKVCRRDPVCHGDI
jgi:hypothetical protein